MEHYTPLYLSSVPPVQYISSTCYHATKQTQATMAPNIKDQLPILKQIIQYFKKDGLVVDSPLMKIHNQMSCMVIGIGFIFISVENYLDTKAILCHSGQQFHAYAK